METPACYTHAKMSAPGIEIELPCSKSIALRALTLRYSTGLDIPLHGMTPCKDIDEMERGLRLLAGAHEGDRIRIVISEGAAPFRFLTALAASTPGVKSMIIPGNRLAERPIGQLVEALRRAGAEITLLRDGILDITGRKIAGGMVEIDNSISSQFESALLLASPLWERGLSLPEPDLREPSAPYRMMTRRMLDIFKSHPDSFLIEGDWSAASYFFEARMIAAAMGRTLRFSFPSLGPAAESLQGDSRIADFTEEIMATVGVFTADMRSTPDLVPALAVGCAISGKGFRFSGTANLRHKESDRIEALATELGRLGYRLDISEENGTTISCDGVRRRATNGNITINPHGDHRMAMAFAMAKTAIPGIIIENPEVVGKSFPGFWQETAKIPQLSTT